MNNVMPGTLASGGSATVTIVVTANSGPLSNTATTSSTTDDPNQTNNTATTTTTVTQPGTHADLSISKGDAPDPVVAGQSLTYTLTVVVAVALLLAWFGSSVLLVTVAVLERGPLLAVTTIVIVAEPPLARLPRLQVTVVVPLQLPTLGVAETKLTPAGNGSLSTTAAAASGPPLETIRV